MEKNSIFRIKIIALMSLICLLVNHAQASTLSTSFADRFIENFEDDWFISLGFATSPTIIKHNDEASGAAGFLPLESRSIVNNNFINLALNKEFLSKSRFSLTATVSGGQISGSKDGQVESIAYAEKNSGNLFAFNLSGNLNYYAYRIKFQPFFGLGVRQENTTYSTEYSNGANIKNEYKYSASVGELSLGLRFLDPDVSLMSYFSISATNVLSEKIEGRATVAGTSSSAIEGSIFERAILHAALGFGFLF